MQVVNGVYDHASGQVVFYSRDSENNLVRTKERGEHVAYLRAEDVTQELRRELRSNPNVSFHEKESGWVRVTCRDYVARKLFVDSLEGRGVETFEGDLNPVKRFVADREDVEIAKPRRCYLDLETDSRVPFSRKEETRILCWALTDDEKHTRACVLEEDSDADEKELLRLLFLELDQYDQVCAWNGDGFDFVVLAARVEHAGWSQSYLKRWLWMDQMLCFKRMNLHAAESGDEKQSMALQNIGMAVLGRGKTKFDASKTYQEWEVGGERRQRLVDYCCDDVELLPDLERERPYLALHQAVCETCKVFPDSWSLKPTAFVDGFMFQLGRERGHHFRTKLRFDEKPAGFAGALRGEVPKGAGILRDVHVVDFASLYPTIIRTFNMSPETAAPIPCNGPIPEGHCRAPKTGKGFRLEPTGILAEVVAEIMRQRVAWKKRGQAAEPGSAEEKLCEQMVSAMKIINNSVFGVAASPGSRYADRSIGEAITQTGVWAVTEVATAIEARGWRQISIDTDGVMFQGTTAEGAKDLVREVNEVLLPPKIATFGCRENFVSLDYALEFSRLVYCSTGRYVARLSHRKGKPWHEGMKPEIKGMEYVRGDSLRLARDLQGEVIDLLCGGLGLAKIPTPTDVVADYVSAVERCRKRVLEEPLSVDEVKISKSMSKELGDYSQKIKKDGTAGAQPPHVRVAKILAARGEDVSDGTRVAYVVTDGEKGTVIPASDYAGEVDRAHLWDHAIFPATQRLLEAAFPAEPWKRFLVGKRHEANLQAGLFSEQLSVSKSTVSDLIKGDVEEEDVERGIEYANEWKIKNPEGSVGNWEDSDSKDRENVNAMGKIAEWVVYRALSADEPPDMRVYEKISDRNWTDLTVGGIHVSVKNASFKGNVTSWQFQEKAPAWIDAEGRTYRARSRDRWLSHPESLVALVTFDPPKNEPYLVKRFTIRIVKMRDILSRLTDKPATKARKGVPGKLYLYERNLLNCPSALEELRGSCLEPKDH